MGKQNLDRSHPASRADIRVAQTVLDEMDQRLPPDQVAAVAHSIDHLADEPGIPLRMDFPGPLGASYLAAIPDHDHAPVVIYRPASPGEQGSYVVTALVDRASYLDSTAARSRTAKR